MVFSSCCAKEAFRSLPEKGSGGDSPCGAEEPSEFSLSHCDGAGWIRVFAHAGLLPRLAFTFIWSANLIPNEDRAPGFSGSGK